MKIYNIIKEEYVNLTASENLLYHINNNVPITESVFRLESESFDKLLHEARELYDKGYVEFNNQNDKYIFENTDTGRKAVHKGKTVTLDKPMRATENKNKAWKVYRSTGRKNKDGKTVAKIIYFGDPNLPIRNSDPDAAKSFRARHKCSEKTDRDTPGWWACYALKYYSDVMGLSSSAVW